VIAPKRSLRFKGVKASHLKFGKDKIPAENIDLRTIDYVPIYQPSYITPATYLGMMGDPLVEMKPAQISNMDGNYALLVTVRVPPGIAAGTYKGTLEIEINSKVRIPFNVKVYDFELPEYSTFQSGMGGQYLMKRGRAGGRLFADYHGVKTKTDLKKLARKYYDVMAMNKFYPKTVVLYSEIGMNWSPPPQGYNVDAPGNYFKLYDWDFTEFNRDLEHYIDDLKVNSVCLTHTNPRVSNMFKHLPGAQLEEFSPSTPHVTMAWQTFREHTFVVWGKREGDAYYDETIEVTQKQWDRLVLDYYRAMAANLDRHGWLDKFYICVDETTDVKRLLHLLRLLKSDPLTARIKVIACMQGLEYFHYKEQPDQDYAFKDLLTYMPQNDEQYNRWEKYFFTDYDIKPDRDKLWNYGVGTSRLVIDTPGINNRMTALDIFNRGGSGFFVWDTIIYGPGGRASADNPWIDPYCNWGNGAVSYFYPPLKNGFPDKPDFTVIPSLRIMTFRESVDDFEYATILEDLIAAAERQGLDSSEGKAIINDIARFFYSSVHWSQNDAWYLGLRQRMAEAIVNLKRRLN